MNASLPNKSINFFLKSVLTTNVWIYTHTYILINIYNLLHCILEFQNLQIYANKLQSSGGLLE